LATLSMYNCQPYSFPANPNDNRDEIHDVLGLFMRTSMVIRFQVPAWNAKEPRFREMPKSSLHRTWLESQIPLTGSKYPYTSPLPEVLHISRVLKQSLPVGCFPPEHPSTSGPPRSPGSFPPLTKLNPESNATS